MGPVEKVNLRKTKLKSQADPEETFRRHVTIFDDTLTAIDITLWGPHCNKTFTDSEESKESEGKLLLKQGDILILKGGKLSAFGGKSVNSSDDSSELFVNEAKLESNLRVKEVTQWFKQLSSECADFRIDRLLSQLKGLTDSRIHKRREDQY